MLHETLSSVHQNILRPIQFSVKRKNLACIPLASSTLLAEVTQAQKAATAVEVARVMVMLAVETSVREAAAARDSATFCVRDVEVRTTLAEREELERMSRAKAENDVAFSSAR
jgi:hypothetical protein